MMLDGVGAGARDRVQYKLLGEKSGSSGAVFTSQCCCCWFYLFYYLSRFCVIEILRLLFPKRVDTVVVCGALISWVSVVLAYYYYLFLLLYNPISVCLLNVVLVYRCFQSFMAACITGCCCKPAVVPL